MVLPEHRSPVFVPGYRFAHSGSPLCGTIEAGEFSPGAWETAVDKARFPPPRVALAGRRGVRAWPSPHRSGPDWLQQQRALTDRQNGYWSTLTRRASCEPCTLDSLLAALPAIRLQLVQCAKIVYVCVYTVDEL